MGTLFNRVRSKDLKPGDHIYSWRAGHTYAHHGIYVARNTVIHFTRGRNEESGTSAVIDLLYCSAALGSRNITCPDCGMTGDSSSVVRSCLDCFLVDCSLYRFQYGVSMAIFITKGRGGTCTFAKADAAEIVLHRAEYLFRSGFGIYHLFDNNCEDFAMYCKTRLLVVNKFFKAGCGQTASLQGAQLAVAVSSLLTGIPSAMAMAAVSTYLIHRYRTDIGIRKDVIKIAVEDLAIKIRAEPAPSGAPTGR